MNVRCEVCLKRDGWAQPTANILLATINGKESLVCRRHDPKRKFQRSQGNESKSYSN